MLIYLLALPIWNFVLPVYAFWHFDDFSWGQTRMVQGENGKDGGHGGGGKGDTTTDAESRVEMKKWEEWEVLRRRALLLKKKESLLKKEESSMSVTSNVLNQVSAALKHEIELKKEESFVSVSSKK